MKKLLFLSGFLLMTNLAATAQSVAVASTVSAPTRAAAVFAWNQSSHHFGSIPQGKPVSTTFRFTNTGSVPLIISQVQGSCGCTATEYSREPIAPGKMGYVKATYQAATAGPFHKTVTITANTGSPVQLSITGEVKSE